MMRSLAHRETLLESVFDSFCYSMTVNLAMMTRNFEIPAAEARACGAGRAHPLPAPHAPKCLVFVHEASKSRPMM